MDLNITRRERMREKWHELARLGMVPGPLPVEPPASTFRIDPTPEELAQRERDIADGKIPF